MVLNIVKINKVYNDNENNNNKQKKMIDWKIL